MWKEYCLLWRSCVKQKSRTNNLHNQNWGKTHVITFFSYLRSKLIQSIYPSGSESEDMLLFISLYTVQRTRRVSDTSRPSLRPSVRYSVNAPVGAPEGPGKNSPGNCSSPLLIGWWMIFEWLPICLQVPWQSSSSLLCSSWLLLVFWLLLTGGILVSLVSRQLPHFILWCWLVDAR